MIQEILTYTAVAWAFSQVILFFWRIFKPRNNASVCGGGCSSCSAKSELIKQVEKGKFPTLLKDNH